ncbi:hypothetical protein TcYC6_0050690 [Trypanosoma cruzi]|nr:hypothetical protein TcYC6_0050690 [Trypanosoma cruzi]
MSTSSIEGMDGLIGAATAFLRAMGDDQREGSIEWMERRKQALFEGETRDEEMGVSELLERVHERLSGDNKGIAGGAKMPTGVDAKGGTYWFGKRPLPGLTEEEVDAALQWLSEEERRQLADEFDALRNDGFVVLRKRHVDPAPVGETVVKRDSETHDGDNGRNSDNADIPMSPNRSDGKSMFFGGNLLEVSYDEEAWPLSTRREICAMAPEGQEMEKKAAASFDKPNMYSRDAAAPKTVFSSDSLGCATPSYEKEQSDYIRDKVRMMLLANRVAKDVERNIVDAALGVAQEWRTERERRLQLLLERQTEALRDAVRVMESLKTLHRRAMGEYVENPYLMQTWQRNESAQACHKCRRPFNLLVMRHHCRRCGLIFCQRCSSYAGMLPDKNANRQVASQWLRLCQDCYEICCEYQKCVSTSFAVPRGRCERESRAPETPSSILLSKYPNDDGVLEDKLPPFYVVLPEEWYTVRTITASGWLNVIRNVPYMFCENFQDGVSSLSRMARPGLERLLSSTTESVKRIKDEK